ncbi:hypothetical protein WA158_004605 [Blastocystis sp. Blastoise]
MSSVDIEDLHLEQQDYHVDEEGSVKISRSVPSKVKESKGHPESYKLWIKTFGCAHNVSDGEYMEGLLASYGYRFVVNKLDADLWVLNSCTVKDPSEQAFRNLVEEGLKNQKKIVVAGCVPQAERSLKGLDDVSVLGVNNIHRIVEIVEQTLNGNRVVLLKQKEMPPLDMPKIRKDKDIEIIPLSIGCLGHCTYCKTVYARGVLKSYSIPQICDRIQTCHKEGVNEIWLSSEDTGAYGRDLGIKLQDLLKEIQNMNNHPCMYRIGMTNPPYILDSLPAIAEFLKQPYVYSFIHIPVQSGSNKVLTEMRRQYSREDYITVCDYLFANVPGLTIATDIIVGYATENNQDFEDTMSLLHKYDQPIVNISRFFPRPGTPAATLPHTPGKVMKERSKIISEWFKYRQPYKQYLNRYERIWVGNEIEGKYSVGHTKAYIKVLIPYDASLIGKSIIVKIINTFRFHIVGRVICRDPEELTQSCSPYDYDILIPKNMIINEEISTLEEEMNKNIEKEHTGLSDDENEELDKEIEQDTNTSNAEEVEVPKAIRGHIIKKYKVCNCGANPGGLCIGECNRKRKEALMAKIKQENALVDEMFKPCTCGKNPEGPCIGNCDESSEKCSENCTCHEE